MTDEQRARMESLFEQAAALDPAERHAFLSGACSDLSVIREVESLLEFAQTGSHSLADPVGALAARVGIRGAEEGRRIGPYRVGREIGRGGMGAVYLASRDEEFCKTVALKVLPVGMHSESAVRRFRQERQILAELEHPNIARLLDGGTTEDGLPYLAMEYVAGVPITQYAAERGLSVNRKLRLFRQLCDGVQCAHQKLIIHRDIKPGNILVTDEGVPKLLDFGIAKLTAPDTAAGDLPETATLLALTPDYASPEQVLGEPVTVATDVYALGAVLFELLTGQRAHRLKSYDPLELARQICQTETRAPSSTGAAGLRGDLDNIVLKAMQKDPRRRYNSAEQFAEDIRRYLEGLPVIARPDTAIYRTTKFARRHWAGLGAVAAIILALGGGAIVAWRQARLAEARFAEGRKLAQRLFEIHEELKNEPGTTKPRQLVVSSALEYLDRLAPTAGNDPDFQWELARAYERTGDAQGSPDSPSLGRTQDAAKSYEKAIRIEEQLLGRGRLSVAQRESMIRSYAMLCLLYRQLRDGQRAVAVARRAVELSNRLPLSFAALSYVELASAEHIAGDSVAALATITKALALERQLTDADWPDSHKMGSHYVTAARVAQSAVRFEEALDFARSGIGFLEKRLREQPNDPGMARDLILLYLTAADCVGSPDRPSLGDAARALPYYRKGLELAEKLAAADANNATAQFDLAIAAGKTAGLLHDSNPAEAVRLYNRALEASSGMFHDGIERSAILSAYHASVAIPLAKLRRVAEAREDFRKSMAEYEQQIAQQPNSPQTYSDAADALRYWGEMEFAAGNGQAALEHLRQGLRYAEKGVALAPHGVRPAWHLAAVLEELAREEEAAGRRMSSQNQIEDARQLRQRALKIWIDWDGLLPHTPYIEAQRRRAERLVGGS